MRTPRSHAPSSLAAVALVSALTLPAPAQQDRPAPAAPQPRSSDVTEPAAGNGGTVPVNRPRTGDDRPVKLGFNDVGIEETFGFLATSTGKVVMPVNLLALRNKKVTLLTEAEVPISRALDLLLQAFRINGVGVIEREDVLIIGLTTELAQLNQAEVIDADSDILARQDKGNFVVKIYRIRNVPAEEIAEHLNESKPDYAIVLVDANSNQILVFGDIALCQHYQVVIDKLDANYLKPETRTFRLAHADAQEVADQILELFEQDPSAAGSQRAQRSARTPRGGQPNQPQQPRVPGQQVGPQLELRVTVSPHANSVTVVGEPAVVKEAARLIDEEWDLPRPTGTSRIFTLTYTDPIKVADRINSLLGQGGSSSGRTGGAGRTGQGGASVEQMLSGIYRIEPYPDTNQILVFAKTEQSLEFLEQFIDSLDQPTKIGLPFVVELKHANAFELAEQLNALLAEAGAGATITAPETGLSGPSLGEVSQGTTTSDGDSAGTLSFPWQRGGRQSDDQSPESPLIGKVRIVPISRQNALAILCPRPQQEAVQELIEYFDRPGRQVMISVVLAELELNDVLALGLRLSSSDDIASSANPDNLFSSTIGIQGSTENSDRMGRLFDTSLIDTNVSITAVIQALKQESNLRVLQQPVVFTADNQEAYFFDGQEIPFITETTINSNGQPTDSFEYKDVGVILNARPRITKTRDIDLELRLELSSVVPGQTLFGGAIIDKRLTTTQVIVKNGQTIVLSGIMKESESTITRKVPFFGDIPIIGELFKSRDNESTTSELVAFITPFVVDNPDENDHNFQDIFRDRLEDLMRPVGEQYEEFQKDPEKYRRLMKPRRSLRDELRELEPGAEEPLEEIDPDDLIDPAPESGSGS